MGERAHVAYQRDDGLFNVHYSHWGAGRLGNEITEETPLGGENSEPGFVTALTSVLEQAADDVDGELDGYMTEAQESTEIEPQPFEVGVTIRDIAQDVLNYGTINALYVVTRDWKVHEFMTYRTQFRGDGDCSTGLLVNHFDHGYWMGKFRGFKTCLKDRMKREELDVEEAEDILLRLMLEEYEQPLDKFVLPVSSAVSEEHYEEYPNAFFPCSGRTRLLGDMYPMGVQKIPVWAVPSEFPEVKTADGERVSIVQD